MVMLETAQAVALRWLLPEQQLARPQVFEVGQASGGTILACSGAYATMVMPLREESEPWAKVAHVAAGSAAALQRSHF